MPIARQGQFLVSDTMGRVPHIGLESDRLQACIGEIKRSKWKGVFGSPIFGFHESTLDALQSLFSIESVWFWEVTLQDIDALYTLPHLLSMGVSPRRPAIDHSRISTLTDLTIQPVANDRGIQTLTQLQRLSLWHFRPGSGTFDDFELPPNLIDLEINWANVRSLAGLTPRPTIRRLEFHRCRNLTSISGVAKLFPNLEHLVVSACGKLNPKSDEDEIRQLPLLRHAFVQKQKIV